MLKPACHHINTSLYSARDCGPVISLQLFCQHKIIYSVFKYLHSECKLSFAFNLIVSYRTSLSE